MTAVDTERADVLIIEKWPDIPGHAGSTRMFSARRRKTSEDGRYWLIRRRGLFRRWRWMPRRGLFVSLYDVSGLTIHTDGGGK